MRESNFTFPHQNRAVVSITHMLYDRRALDTSSNIALLNNLTSLTYLTSTSPRIREILTWDGGLERLMDILRESRLPRPGPVAADWWGLNGPSTARIIGIDREVSLRHSLAFQSLVNIGVRGSEAIRTRVVQAGALDLVAQILESWLQQYDIGIVPAPYGSQAAIDAHRMGRSTSTEPRRRARSIGSRGLVNTSLSPSARASLSQFIAAFNPRSIGGTFSMSGDADTARADDASSRTGDTDVDMADGEGEGEEGTEVEDERSIGGMEDSMEVDEPERAQSAPPEDTAVDQAAVATTPRASVAGLPQPMAIPARALRETTSVASSVNDSYADVNDAGLPRIASDNNLAGTARMPIAAGPSRLGHLVPNDALSVPVAGPSAQPPLRPESAQGQTRRRDTITARPTNLNNLAPRNDRERGDNSETSDGGGDHEEQTRTIVANVNLGAIQGRQPFFTGPPDARAEEVIDVATIPETGQPEEPDADAIAAEQARLDMEAGAPPGQPGAAQTPRIEAAQNPDPMAAAGAAAMMTAVPPGLDVNNGAPTQIIIANGAPRGFTDLGAYFGVSSHLNPDANQYSEDSILLALQLLAYLSKYPHVRSAFHHPRRPMHPTFELNPEITKQPLPEREPTSQTSNIFSLVERFTFRPSPSDPRMYTIPSEVQYWAGVIMRNACRKDEARGGIRQCAHMSCGKWESIPREFAKCRRCRKAKYCSKECQSRAWQEGHRFWCNPRTDLEMGQQADAQAGGSGGPGGGGGGRPGPGGGGGDDDEDDVGRPPRPTQGGGGAAAAFPAGNHLSGPGPGVVRTTAQATASATPLPTFQQAADHPGQRTRQHQRGEPAPITVSGITFVPLQPGVPHQDGVVGLLPRPPPSPAAPRRAAPGGVVLPPSIMNATIWGFDQREVGTLAAATAAARPPPGGSRHRNPIGNFDLPFR